MPITFSEVNALPDILAIDRFQVFFPDIPGMDVKNLSIKTVSVTLPPLEVAQILVKIFGWSRTFAGRRVHQNSISFTVYEDVTGDTITALVKWQNDCAGFTKAGGLMHSDYAKDVEIQVYDTKGETALHLRCNKAWPMRINLPQLDDDQSAPMRVDMDFSLDSIDFVGLEDVANSALYTSSTSVSLPKSITSNATKSPVSVLTQIPSQYSFIANQFGLSPNLAFSVLNKFLNSNISLSRDLGSVSSGLTRALTTRWS